MSPDTVLLSASEARLIPLEERFWGRVCKNTGDDACWEWLGALHDGYGHLRVNGRRIRAHWFLLDRYPNTRAGEIACHHCDNRRCVRPNHIFIGTIPDNNRDRDKKGRCRSNTRAAVQARIDRGLTFGDKNNASKLTNAQAAMIKSIGRVRGMSRKFGNELGVSDVVIINIWMGKTWSTVVPTEADCEAGRKFLSQFK